MIRKVILLLSLARLSLAVVSYVGSLSNVKLFSTYVGSPCTGTPYQVYVYGGACYTDSSGATCSMGGSCVTSYSTGSDGAIDATSSEWSSSTACAGDATKVSSVYDTGVTTTCETSNAPFIFQYTTSATLPDLNGATVAFYPNSACEGYPYQYAYYPLNTCFVSSPEASAMTTCDSDGTTCSLKQYSDGFCTGTTTGAVKLNGGFTTGQGCVVDPNGSTINGIAAYVTMQISTAAPSAVPTLAPTATLSTTNTIIVGSVVGGVVVAGAVGAAVALGAFSSASGAAGAAGAAGTAGATSAGTAAEAASLPLGPTPPSGSAGDTTPLLGRV